MPVTRTWPRQVNGKLMWINEVDGRLTVSNQMPINQNSDNTRALTRTEQIAWRVLRRTPKYPSRQEHSSDYG
jgi:hypothetical protein